ncbi:unnamed protein product [Caretta caretta]
MAVEEGGVARVQCLIQGVPKATITWERNRPALPPGDHRFTLLPAGILQITGVQRADVGSYRCVASNIANSRCSQEAQLAISVSAPKLYKEPMILSGPQNLTITVHQMAILECIATGNPRPIVSWSRLAPPEFVQWPQLVSKPLGSHAIFTCVAQGVPEPLLIWLKNGKILVPSETIKLTHNNSSPSTLLLQGLTVGDEAIYQCMAENRADTNQASARLALALAQELPSSPEGVRAAPLSTTSIQVSWQEPPPRVPAAPSFFTKVLNASMVQVFQALPPQPGRIEGFKLFHRKLPSPHFEGPQLLASTANSYIYSNLEPSAPYELQLQAFNGNGDSNSTVRPDTG